MHNLIPFNQLAGSYDEPSNDLITEYYECLIDCDDDQHICKRICKEVLPKKCTLCDIARGVYPLFFVINTYMKDKKAAKLILKRAKKNPLLYSIAEIFYAKKVKNLEKDALSHQETKPS